MSGFWFSSSHPPSRRGLNWIMETEKGCGEESVSILLFGGLLMGGVETCQGTAEVTEKASLQIQRVRSVSDSMLHGGVSWRWRGQAQMHWGTHLT